jgi:hypothetical protein
MARSSTESPSPLRADGFEEEDDDDDMVVAAGASGSKEGFEESSSSEEKTPRRRSRPAGTGVVVLKRYIHPQYVTGPSTNVFA